jgi:hypothetical protein
MKRIWGWLSEVLFVEAKAPPVARAVIAIDTPEAWSLSQVNELRWA